MMVLAALITPLILALSISAAPCATKTEGCDTSSLTIPGFLSPLPAPDAGTPLSFVVVGVGVQNYACSATGNYTSTGALAGMYDMSCLSNSPEFSTIQDVLLAAWKQVSDNSVSAATVVVDATAPYQARTLLGEHFFVVNPVTGTGISPVWDFTSAKFAKGNPQAFVLAAKTADVPAPTGSRDVDWLELSAVSGSLAKSVYRTDTREGQPPASCTPGSPDIQVKYTAKYWLFGGDF